MISFFISKFHLDVLVITGKEASANEIESAELCKTDSACESFVEQTDFTTKKFPLTSQGPLTSSTLP